MTARAPTPGRPASPRVVRLGQLGIEEREVIVALIALKRARERASASSTPEAA